MNLLLEEWKGSGEIECRDVGPYRCLLTFSSTEIRDEAMHNQLLHGVFDEIRPHWDIFWSLSKREFGSKVYSLQSHPDLEIGNTTSMDETTSISLAGENSAENERSPTSLVYLDLKLTNVGNPLLNAIIERNLDNVQEVGMGCGLWVVDPMWHEAQIDQKHITGKSFEPMGLEHGQKVDGASDCAGFCPFPPGFGLCSDRAHVHREMSRAQKLAQPEGETPAAVEEGEVESVEPPNTSVLLASEENIEAAEFEGGEKSGENQSLGVGYNEARWVYNEAQGDKEKLAVVVNELGEDLSEEDTLIEAAESKGVWAK
ncbi:hypothetical protein PIB30_093109, partial [Stylosanthes scabra]|nr:hypothetical protein [Stylosanthes scabra]